MRSMGGGTPHTHVILHRDETTGVNGWLHRWLAAIPIASFSTAGDARYGRLAAANTWSARQTHTSFLSLGVPDSAAIAAGVVTVTGSHMAVDTEGAAATDNLDTINGGVVGDLLLLRSLNDGRDVVVKHATGNIKLNGAADYTLSDNEDRLLLMFNGATWLEFGRGDNA